MMKNSIRIKITCLLTGSLIFTIFLCWILNKTFLTNYYQADKVSQLESMYHNINDLIGTEKISELTQDMSEFIDRINSNRNVNCYIFSVSNQLFPIYISNEREYSRILTSMQAYMFEATPRMQIEDIEIVKSVDQKYDICKQEDLSINLRYLDLVGFLDSGYMVFFRTNFQSLEESSKLSNQLLAIIGVIVTAVGTLVMYFVSRRFTKPILAMERIAQKMTNLDFDAKYQVKTKDEIGRLGSSINLLSEKLQKTITELKVANNELQTDNERKTQIDEMRKEFLSNVTHELKTPIALIQGYAEGLKENISDDQESREFYCEVIMDEAMKMNKMVQKLLTLNQLEFGTNAVEITRFDITSLIRSVLASTDILIKQNQIKVQFEQSNPCYVWADEYMIEEVITNYISNAIHHVSGARIIEIKLSSIQDHIRVSVYNTGELIPEDELDKVWIKFYKVDKARTREYGGNGIGLSIVKAIMNLHNKPCGVKNHTNGVEFWFELDADRV